MLWSSSIRVNNQNTYVRINNWHKLKKLFSFFCSLFFLSFLTRLLFHSTCWFECVLIIVVFFPKFKNLGVFLNFWVQVSFTVILFYRLVPTKNLFSLQILNLEVQKTYIHLGFIFFTHGRFGVQFGWNYLFEKTFNELNRSYNEK